MNEINMSHSGVQKYIFCKNCNSSFNISCTGSHKRLWIQYGLWLEMTEKAFSV